MMSRVLWLAGLLLAALAFAQPPLSWKHAEPGYPWSFPRDHWAHHEYQTEWWYFTGHLGTAGEREPRFGYQFTIFRVGLLPEAPSVQSSWTTRSLIMGHASITDLETGTHVFTDALYRSVPLLGGWGEEGDSLIAWCRAPAGTDGFWELRWNGEAFDFSMVDDTEGIAFSLRTRPAKPLVFQGPGGFSRKGAAPRAASLYYSFTRLFTQGTVRVGERQFLVEGMSWMDKEFGSNQLAQNQVGWDWFSLQLTDGRELMIYVLRNTDGRADFGRGTLVDADGTARYLSPQDWRIEKLRTWKSDKTGAEYPSGWRIGLPAHGLSLRVDPLLRDQENVGRRSGSLFYWEGAVSILGSDGNRVGRGYVELTGYGPDNRPPI